ncbi:MAG: hypothetical protein JRN44_02725 [Nitrososphaerota archaeon]|jgi:hypothetical protein|nr:hypothetical protein [Nitrososphaerota archaeon]
MELSLGKKTALTSAFAILLVVSLAISVAYALPPSGSNPSNVIGGGTAASNCLSSVPHALVLPDYNTGKPNVTVTATGPGFNGTVTKLGTLPFSNVTLAANGTTTINGKAYWYVTFIPEFTSYMDEAYINFHGVTFFLSSVVQYEYSGRMQGMAGVANSTSSVMLPVDYKISLSDATMLVAKTSSGAPCSYFLPQVTVQWNFPVSEHIPSQSYNQASITFTQIGANKTNFIDSEVVSFPPSLPNPWFTQGVDPQAGVSYQTNGGGITLYVSTS